MADRVREHVLRAERDCMGLWSATSAYKMHHSLSLCAQPDGPDGRRVVRAQFFFILQQKGGRNTARACNDVYSIPIYITRPKRRQGEIAVAPVWFSALSVMDSSRLIHFCGLYKGATVNCILPVYFLFFWVLPFALLLLLDATHTHSPHRKVHPRGSPTSKNLTSLKVQHRAFMQIVAELMISFWLRKLLFFMK